MATRRIDRELRITAALDSLVRYRSRAYRTPESVTERQRKDRRQRRFDSATDVAGLLATVDAVGAGAGVAASAAGGGGSGSGYYENTSR